MGKKLYVGNLPYSTTDASLAEVFAQVGKVESAKVVMDRETGRSRGFGFVEMSTDAEAADAVSRLHGVEYDGRAMTVTEARSQEAGAGRAGAGGRGGFGGAGRGRY